MSFLDQKFFINNRHKLAELTGAELIIIAGNGLLQSVSDLSYPFRQDSNFFYLTGIELPNLTLVIDVKASKEYIILSKQSEVSKDFDGEVDTAALALKSGITEFVGSEQGWLQLKSRLTHAKRVHSVNPPSEFVDHYMMYTNPTRRALHTVIAEHKNTEIIDVLPFLAEMRVIKQDQELKALQHAADLTEKALLQVNEKINTYEYEYQIDADLTHIPRSLDNRGLGFETIVAGGENACTIHYRDNSAKIDKTKPILIDYGVEVEHYSADISRTFIPNDARIEAVMKEVEAVSQAAFDSVKPGVDFLDHEKKMRAVCGESLVRLGLIDINLEKNVRPYFPHATSHFLGLDTHDLGDYKQAFRPGMVITIEPGIYIQAEGIGIRIEDDVLITDNGVQHLTNNLQTRLNSLA